MKLRTGARPLRLLILLLLLAAAAGSWQFADRSALAESDSAGAPATLPAEPSAMAASAQPGQPAASEPAGNPEQPGQQPASAQQVVDIDLKSVHRASAAQRVEDARRLREDADLFDLRESLMTRALAGDADAAQALAELMSECSFPALEQDDRELGSLQRRFDLDEAHTELLVAISVVQRRRCSSIGRGNPDWYADQAFSWTEIAAQMQHPAALARHPTDPSEPGSAEEQASTRRAALLRMLDEGSADTLLQHWVELGSASGLNAEAFVLAHCAMLPTCAPDPWGHALRVLQSGSPPSQAALYAWLTLRYASPRQRLVLVGQAERILALWRARRWQDLIAPQTYLAEPVKP